MQIHVDKKFRPPNRIERKCLAETHPDLVPLWNQDKNQDFTPENCFKTQKRKIWWNCSHGHLYQMGIKDHIDYGPGCPICDGAVVPGENDLATLMPEIAAQWDFEKNGNLTPDQVTPNMHIFVGWVCEHGHHWACYIDDKCNGKKCISCLKSWANRHTLAETHPDLAKQWDYEKNGDLKPEDMAEFSNKKVWWKCEYGHRWQAVIGNRVKGTSSCPFCKGLRLEPGVNDLATLCPDVAKEWDYEKNDGLTPDMFTSKSNFQFWWVCEKKHHWKASITHRTPPQSSGCPFCNNSRVLSGFNDFATLFPDAMKEYNFQKNAKEDIDLKKIPIYSPKKVWWICAKGHEWKTSFHSRSLGGGCPYCSGRFAIQGETDLATTHPEIAAEWDYVKNAPLTPQMVTRSSAKKVWWTCPEDHSYQCTVFNRTTGGCNCPYCSGQKVVAGINDFASAFPDLAKEWSEENPVPPTRVYEKSRGTRYKWICKNGHLWQATIGERLDGVCCPVCEGRLPDPRTNTFAIKCSDMLIYWDYEKNTDVDPNKIKPNYGKPVWWRCPKCGTEWEDSPGSMKARRNKCPYCSGHRIIPGKTDFATLNPSLAAEWNYERNNPLDPHEFSTRSGQVVWWKCEMGHEWQASIASRKTTDCPYCRGKYKNIIPLKKR